MFSKMFVQNAGIQSLIFSDELLDLRAEIRIAENGAERAVKNLPAGIGKTFAFGNIGPKAEIGFFKGVIVRNGLSFGSCGESGRNVIGRSIGVVS